MRPLNQLHGHKHGQLLDAQPQLCRGRCSHCRCPCDAAKSQHADPVRWIRATHLNQNSTSGIGLRGDIMMSGVVGHDAAGALLGRGGHGLVQRGENSLVPRGTLGMEPLDVHAVVDDSDLDTRMSVRPSRRARGGRRARTRVPS